MRVLVALLLSAVSLAGCTNELDDASAIDDGVNFYRVSYEGSDRMSAQPLHGEGFLTVVRNDGAESVVIGMPWVTTEDPEGYDGLVAGIPFLYEVTENGTEETQPNILKEFDVWTIISFELEADSAVVVGVEMDSLYGHQNVTLAATWPVGIYDAQTFELLRNETLEWDVEVYVPDFPREFAEPDYHVQTITVGFWPNGTSFYTNVVDLINDTEFPGAPSWVTMNDSSEPLPIYVYDQDRREQPIGSRDACYFTTIDGYNELLQTQIEGSTNIRLLQPEEAYTVEGREPGDRLYGDALIFMNTVVVNEGRLGTEWETPNPDGACYQQDRACSETPDDLPDEAKGPSQEQCEEQLGDDDG